MRKSSCKTNYRKEATTHSEGSGFEVEGRKKRSEVLTTDGKTCSYFELLSGEPLSSGCALVGAIVVAAELES
jgi:hypothetical protein